MTKLVHEAYVRLVDANQILSWDGRGSCLSSFQKNESVSMQGGYRLCGKAQENSINTTAPPHTDTAPSSSPVRSALPAPVPPPGPASATGSRRAAWSCP